MTDGGRLLGLSVLASITIFVGTRWLLSRVIARSPRAFTRGDAAEMVLTGAGVPQALCLVLWPVWPGLLTVVTDVPLLLIPTGAIMVVFSIGAILNWK